MNLEEIINLAFKKVMGKKPTQKGSSFAQRQQDKEQLTQQGYNPMTGKFTESFTDKYDDNPKLKGKQSKLPDALQKAIINKTNEHHLKSNPDAKYVAVYGGAGFFDVWEGEPFDETGEKGVRVARFGSIEDAKDYANTKNAEQGKLEEEFEFSDSAKASLEKIKQIRDRRAKAKEPKKSDPTIAQRGGHDKVYKDYLKEDSNKIAALEKKRADLMRNMEQEAEPEGGPIADRYGAELDRIDKALEKLKGSKKQYKILSTAELNKLARIKR